MKNCKACRRPICDGQNIVIVTEGTILNEGGVEYGDAEYFHPDCITIDY